MPRKKPNYLYDTWYNIKRRCYSYTPAYKHYMDRGITMYPLWYNSFKDFESYILETLGHRPEGYSLDRIDNDGNYEPGNLRWATAEEQAKNKRAAKPNRSTVPPATLLEEAENICSDLFRTYPGHTLSVHLSKRSR